MKYQFQILFAVSYMILFPGFSIAEGTSNSFNVYTNNFIKISPVLKKSTCQNFSRISFGEISKPSASIKLSYLSVNSLNLLAGSTPMGNKAKGDIMPNIQKRALISGGLFIPTMALGYILTNSSKPLSTLLLTGHKLTGAANLFLLNYTVYQKHKAKPLDNYEILGTVLMNVCFIGTIATGALLSLDKPMPEFVYTLHSITPWLSIITSGILYLLLGN